VQCSHQGLAVRERIHCVEITLRTGRQRKLLIVLHVNLLTENTTNNITISLSFTYLLNTSITFYNHIIIIAISRIRNNIQKQQPANEQARRGQTYSDCNNC